MNKLFIPLLTCTLLTESAYAQQSNDAQLPPTVFTYVEKMPEPDFDMRAYMDTSIHYPEKARKNKIEGRIIVKFIVNEDGSVSDVNVTRGIDPACDEEAKRMVTAMPRWKPGKQNGKAVKTYYNLPINFMLK